MRIPATLLLLLLLPLSPDPVLRGAWAQSQPAAAVTTDSVDYCDDLARRLPPAPTEEVARLRREGLTMCDQGHVRGGIMQLRRALMLARDGHKDGP